MGSILILANGKKLDYDRAHEDAGKQPEYTMHGNHKILLDAGSPPKPKIFQRGGNFFTNDGSPVTAEIARPWLEDDKWSQEVKDELRAFLAKIEAGKKPKEKMTTIRHKKAVSREVKFAPEDAGLSSTKAERV